MRTAVWETVLANTSQIALGNCSKKVVGEGQYIWFWWSRGLMQPSTYFTKGFLLVGHEELMPPWRDLVCFSRYEEVQGFGSWKSAPENIYLKTCSTSFPEAQNALFSSLNSLQGVLKVNNCSSTGLNLHRSRWQMPLASASSNWQDYI